MSPHVPKDETDSNVSGNTLSEIIQSRGSIPRSRPMSAEGNPSYHVDAVDHVLWVNDNCAATDH